MNINDYINKLKNVALYVLFNDEEKTIDIVKHTMLEVINGMPDIMQIYLHEEMSDYINDMKYWPQEVEKIYSLLDDFDRFALFDALYFELRGNLISLQLVCDEKGIAIE